MICTSNLKCIVNNLIGQVATKNIRMGVRFFTKYLLLPFFGRVYYRNKGKEIPMENHRKEVSFISQSILYSVLRGSIVGIAAGLVVVVFRLAIEKLFGVFFTPLSSGNR
jgi:hypothetical protein